MFYFVIDEIDSSLVLNRFLQDHSTRAALTGLRKRGYVIERNRPDKGEQPVYRIVHAPLRSQAA